MYLRKYSEIRREKKKKIFRMAALCIGIAFVVIASGIITANIVFNRNREKPVISINPFEVIPPKEVSLVMVGDNLLHMPLVKNGEQEDGTYNFDSLYEEMKSYFETADCWHPNTSAIWHWSISLSILRAVNRST